MRQNWIPPKVIIGSTAIGDYYYPRPQIESSIWEEIHKGNHVLLAAPRRVGKSSVMQAMVKNCPEDTRCIFKDIEGIKSEVEFYQQFFELIIQCLNKFQKGKHWLSSFLREITIEEITLDGIKFGDKKPTDYVQEINSILPNISSQGVKIVLLIDELPELLNKLYKNGRQDEASNILNHLREWRQNPDIRPYFSLVLAGSVGIHHVVKTIEGRTVGINDFGIVPFEALTLNEATHYITWATEDASIQYDEPLLQYLLLKINHFIPYFINLMLDEIDKSARKTAQFNLNETTIDTAFDSIVKNNDHFKDWKNRLFDYFSPADSAFLHNVLIYIAHRNVIDPRQLYNLATKHHKQNTYMELMHGLEHDGYIIERKGQFVFVSPFLQAFWKIDNPVFDYE